MDKIERKNTCLIIDDEQTIQDLLSEVLDKLNIQVSSCFDGIDAGWKMSNQEFNVVIVDKNLPKRDGLTLIKNEILSGRLDPKRVILISGLLQPSDVTMMKELKLEHILVKPFKIADVHKKVNLILSHQ